ncbi:MAG: monofunctional biosynthetic peptidoglycan transglycosylase [Nitrospinae bacterium]|nr:monofunctional biosynthetic peptidoglycan transglycosylase [Nitrospinota bacterium]MZH45856.1 monofunctional biosynthetic peptidoglycan transglycosylase [Nitrospinota bacterium]
MAKKRKRGKKSIKIRIWKICFDFFLCFVALTLVPVLFYRYVNPPSTPLMWVRWFESDTPKKFPLYLDDWQSIDQVSPNIIKAVLAAEDQKFFNHHGFDWLAIEYAIQTNLTTDRKVGASTITMQTARNVFLWQTRTWFRKLLESYFTVLIEFFWSKQRILEVYLNVIEWGDGIFGCEKAAQTYFRHSSKTLSPVESAWMAAVLPNPRHWSIRPKPKHVQVRQIKILDTLPHMKPFK